MPLTQAKLRVYQSIFDMMVKALLIASALVAFFIMLYFIISSAKDDDSVKKYSLGACELILTGTLFQIYRHYFPSKAKESKDKPHDPSP
jgi:hypothetical protein